MIVDQLMGSFQVHEEGLKIKGHKRNMMIMLMNVEVPLITLKDKPTMLERKIKKNLLFCWHIKEKVKT